MKRLLRWLAILCVLVAVGIGGYFVFRGCSPLAFVSGGVHWRRFSRHLYAEGGWIGGYWWYSGRSPLALLSGSASRTGSTRQFQAAGGAQGGATAQPVAIRPAADVIGQVSASGHIGLSSEQVVVLKVAGIVLGVNVKPGDWVGAGDELVVLDRTELERAARQAELAVATQKNALDQLREPASADEITQAQAELASAKANSASVQAGPSTDQIGAAKAGVAAAWAK